MYDIQYLSLLAESYPNLNSVASKIVKLKNVYNMPKGTEYFFSDLHGEYEAFLYQLKSASGVIKSRIDELFSGVLTEEEIVDIAELIYEPKGVLRRKSDDESFNEWYKRCMLILIDVCKDFSFKTTINYTLFFAPVEYREIVSELLYYEGYNKSEHTDIILNSILETGISESFMCGFCRIIRDISIDRLHIIGDLFDRGPRADIIIDELMNYSHLDIQWGNHDITWIGASLGNYTCIASVIRIGISYNNFDCLEDGYGINLRELSMFANEVYKDDDCVGFYPHLYDENLYDRVGNALSAKMHKAIAVIQFKLEGQMYKRHPEYNMQDRDLLSRVDFKNNTVEIDGKLYSLKTNSFPTVNLDSPLELTDGEKRLMKTLAASFMHSERLQKHIKFLYNNGAMFRVYNNNLLYHGCIPMTENGDFEIVDFDGLKLSGKAYLEQINRVIFEVYHRCDEPNAKESDIFWYLWCSPKSPLSGKSKLATFERCFIDDETVYKEELNPYYRLIEDESICKKILKEFDIGDKGHIMNGHVPVKEGENPVKGGGILFMIDGGISKAYQKKTGIGGYTFIYSSRYMAFAEHKPNEFKNAREIPRLQEVEHFTKRRLVKDTDLGAIIKQKIDALTELAEAYKNGILEEK